MLLDLFCGAGGCAVGYHRAGFDVVGVDHRPMPRYPFPFQQGDALELLDCLLRGGYFRPGEDSRCLYLEDFSAIHASPPCQGYSAAMKHLSSGNAPRLIEECRSLLSSLGKQWVIEGVEGSPLATESLLFGDRGIRLCGSMFGLRIWRHRLFETSFALSAPNPCRHDTPPFNPHRKESRERMRDEFGQVDLEKVWRQEAGVEWMDKETGRQAIPPAYTEFIGRQLLNALA